MRTQYAVTVEHPTGFHRGTHTLTVYEQAGRSGAKYVDGSAFGCSRDYRVATNREAVVLFMAEHACRVTGFKLKGVTS